MSGPILHEMPSHPLARNFSFEDESKAPPVDTTLDSPIASSFSSENTEEKIEIPLSLLLLEAERAIYKKDTQKITEKQTELDTFTEKMETLVSLQEMVTKKRYEKNLPAGPVGSSGKTNGLITFDTEEERALIDKAHEIAPKLVKERSYSFTSEEGDTLLKALDTRIKQFSSEMSTVSQEINYRHDERNKHTEIFFKLFERLLRLYEDLVRKQRSS